MAPRYHLVLLDDDDHSYDYVIEMLGRIFGYGREKAFALASIVDHAGRVVLETAGHEQVTAHQQQIHGYGADRRIARCKGSMSALVEPADGPPAAG
ncbi:MAG: ATP-dependent Clp protease adaptor ClpS [Dehalococcoidia bacterium]|nr:ATP-dependent Clp protease adaptor ClpS [Dehalococcoidia bacterium]